MGRLIYDSLFEVDFDDRTLEHRQIVIGFKLSRNDSFYFTWLDHPGRGDARSSIWIHPRIPLRFKYLGGRTPAINPQWMRHILGDSYTPSGLRVAREPEPSRRRSTPRYRASGPSHSSHC